MDGRELVASPWHDSVLYRAAPGAPDGDDWNAGPRRTVDHVIDRFAPLDLNELLDYVYFRTGPMTNAARGQPLNLLSAQDDPSERRHVPLSLDPPRLGVTAGFSLICPILGGGGDDRAARSC